MARDLRSFIELLKADYPGEFLEVKKGPLNPAEAEPCVILHKLEKQSMWPMVVFDDVLSLDGKKWPGRIAFSDVGTWTKIAASVGLKTEGLSITDICMEVYKRGQNPIKPVLVSEDKAPVKHTVWTGEKANLFSLPAYRKDSKDARPGWLCGIALAKELTTGRYNCSWHRHLIHGPQRSASRIQYRHLYEYMNRYKEAGYEEMPVAWVFGHHPGFQIAASGKIGWDVDEYDYAGGLIGEPLRLVPSSTLGKDFLIPADAEVVVEGYVHLTEKDFNGPWTDFMRYYSPQTLEPVFRPTAVNMRENAIFLHNYVGHDPLSDIGQSAEVYLELKRRYPRVGAVNYIAPFLFIVQYKPMFPGEVNRLAAYAFGALGDLVKILIVVDEDIDPFDPYMVFFSIATRVDPATPQVQILKDMWANRHDPSVFTFLRVGTLLIDSTRPMGAPFPEIGYPTEELMKRVKLEDYISAEDLNSLRSGKIVATWHGI